MTVTTYVGWIADGKPWKNCQPIIDFIATLRRHGYTGPGSGIGDQSHLTANPPEDHCPYSHTPWPGAQPYPFVMAIDIMASEGLDLIDLGGRIFNDKNSNVPGTEPIKYMNWTDSANNCFHDSWMPKHTRFNSTDRGHIHISFRTDYVTSNRMAIYDPYGHSAPEEEDMLPYFLASNDVNDIYLVTGATAPSGKIAAFALGLDQWNAHKALGLKSVTLPARDPSIYDYAPQPWPVGGGGSAPSGGNYTINLSGSAAPA